MRSANYISPGNIEMRADATRPVAGAGEVVVEVANCGICGSDLHMYRNDSLREFSVRATPEGYEIPGHEFSGVIVEIGEGTEGWNLGDKVVGVTAYGGGMAEYVVVPVNPFQLVKIPPGVSFAEAATTEPLADGLQMVRKANVKDGDNIVVFGVGIIGLGVIQSIIAKGIRVNKLIAIDVHAARLEKALELGATDIVNPKDNDVYQAVVDITGEDINWLGRSANIDVVFDCAGYIKHMPGPAPLETALKVIANQGGRIICFGAFEDRVDIDLLPLINKQPVIIGSNGYAAEELVDALQLMKDKKVDREGLVSHQFPLEKISEAFQAQCSPEAIKVMIDIKQ